MLSVSLDHVLAELLNNQNRKQSGGEYPMLWWALERSPRKLLEQGKTSSVVPETSSLTQFSRNPVREWCFRTAHLGSHHNPKFHRPTLQREEPWARVSRNRSRVLEPVCRFLDGVALRTIGGFILVHRNKAFSASTPTTQCARASSESVLTALWLLPLRFKQKNNRIGDPGNMVGTYRG